MTSRASSAIGIVLLATGTGAFVQAVPDAEASPVAHLSRTVVQFSRIGAFATSSVQPVFVTNVGDAQLVVTSIAAAGPNATDFSLGGTCTPPVALAPGERCRLDTTVRISSTSAGTRTATVTIESNASPPASPIELSATREQGITTGFLPSPAWVDFGYQEVGAAAPPATFTLLNPEMAAVIDAVSFYRGDSADFTLTSDCVGKVLYTGTSCVATVGFVPASGGPRSTELQIEMHPSTSPSSHLAFRYSVTGVGGRAPARAVDMNQHGLTGSWYEPATSGQGIEIEVFPDLVAPGTGHLQAAWFTFDHVAGDGPERQRWYTFGGPVRADDAAARLPMYMNVGGNFMAPPATSAARIGDVTLAFADCTTARLDYAFTDGSGRTGSVPLTRLTPSVACGTGGASAGAGDFGLSGNWYDPATSGQGVVFELNPAARVLFFGWYTYALDGQTLGAAGQRWFTGLGNYVPGGRVVTVSLYETTGGLFDAERPTPITRTVGTATVTFQSCSAARMQFSFTAGFAAGRSGSVDLVRVGPVPRSCAY